jgi:hypothetical protein
MIPVNETKRLLSFRQFFPIFCRPGVRNYDGAVCNIGHRKISDTCSDKTAVS